MRRHVDIRQHAPWITALLKLWEPMLGTPRPTKQNERQGAQSKYDREINPLFDQFTSALKAHAPAHVQDKLEELVASVRLEREAALNALEKFKGADLSDQARDFLESLELDELARQAGTMGYNQPMSL
jgi:hypothetical protein